jgi:fatty-acyl-CoA synthase
MAAFRQKSCPWTEIYKADSGNKPAGDFLDDYPPYQGLTIGRFLNDACSRHPEKEIVYDSERLTFSEFGRRVRKIAAALRKSVGVQRGDRVAVLDWDSMRYMESYYSIPMAGGIIHTVNIRYPPELIFYTMQHAQDTHVIIRDEFVPMIEKYKSMFDFVRKWIVVSDGAKDIQTTLPYMHYSDLLSSSDSFEDISNENDRSVLFYTSGTTGMPKGVTFTQRQLILQTLCTSNAIAREPLSLSDQDVMMPLVPMFHVNTWGLPFGALFTGQKYILPGRYNFPKLLESVEKEGVTFSASVPSVLYLLLSAPNLGEHAAALKKVRFLIGGASLPRGLAMKAREIGITVVGAYGLSETCPALTISIFSDAVKRMNKEQREEYALKAGIHLPLVELRVVDEHMKDVKNDGYSVGEVIVRAPWCTEGYYRDPEKTRQLWAGGWMHTGDMGVIDQEGYLQIVDREKDAVKSGGEFIPALLVESVISECRGAGEVAIIGIPDEKWGERPVVLMTKTGDLTEEAVREHLAKFVASGRMQKWWIPDRVVFIDSMPKTSTGKADKKELRKLYARLTKA